MAELPDQPKIEADAPALSVILVVGGQRKRAAQALRSLLDQSAIDRMEILLFDLGPEGSPALPESDHPRVRVERSAPSDLLSAARVRGIHAARASVVCFMEEHCEMQAGWADAVIAAHREPWAAVGTDFINGNPDAGKSDKAFRMNYGVYVRPRRSRGPVPRVAGQNSSFKRDILLRYEPHLELMLNADLVLQWKMQQDGYRLFYEPEVKIAHRNENTFRSLAVGAFYWNWCFSNVRAHMFRWSLLRRAFWISLTPLIPWVRLAKLCVRGLFLGHFPRFQFLRDIPFIVGIGHCSAAGQVAGLLNRIDRGVREFSHFEMNEPRLSRAEFHGMNASANSSARVSVIIPAYESQATARAALESLRRQSFHDFETILIDSGHSDAVARIAADFGEVRYHRSNARLLPHEARNLGVTLAQNDLLVFTDPDIVAAPDWLEKLVAAYTGAGNPVAGAVACLQRNWLETGIHLAKFDLWLPGGKPRAVPVAASVNFLCSRELLERAGGFNGAEMIGDTVLSWDLTRLGERINFAPEAVVYHDHRTSFRQLMRERFTRGADFGRLRSERENWNGARTIATVVVSLLPLRLCKLVLRSLGSSVRAGCVLDGLKTIPVVTAGHAAWLAGEITQYWKRLQPGWAAPEPKHACM